MLHVLIALASMAFATYIFFSPSKAKLYASYSLVAATLVSGLYMVLANPTHMVQACTSGLLYLGLVAATTLAARHKLAIEQ